MRRSWLTCAAALVCAAVPACNGTETGNPIGDGSHLGDEVEGVTPVRGDCELALTELDWNSDWDGSDFSGADVASHLPEFFETSLRWLDQAAVVSDPAAGLGELEVSIEPTGRAFALAPEDTGEGGAGSIAEGPDDVNDGPANAVVGGCARSFQVEAVLGLASSDGALDEQFLVSFEARSYGDTTHTHFRVPVEDLRGTLDSDLTLSDGQSLAGPLALEVEMWLSPAGVNGAVRLAAEVVDEDDNPVDFAPVELGRFPEAQPCGLSAYLLEAGQTLHGFSQEDVIEQLSNASSATWTYEHQEGMTTLSWTLPDGPQAQCVGAEQSGTEFLTMLSLESEDGSVSGSFTVNVYAETDGEGGYRALQMQGGSYEQDLEMALDLGERYALTDPAPLDGFVGGMTDFMVDVSGEPWGVFRYAGLTYDDCPNDGTRNCYGLVPTLLFGAHFGEPTGGYDLDPTTP